MWLSTFGYDRTGALVTYCSARQVFLDDCDATSTSDTDAWQFTFDALGRMTRQQPPDNDQGVHATVADLAISEWVYETGGRLDRLCRYAVGNSCTSSPLRVTDYTHDDLGRTRLERVYTGPVGGTVRLEWTTVHGVDG